MIWTRRIRCSMQITHDRVPRICTRKKDNMLEKPAEFIINLTGADCACRYVMLLGSKVDFFFNPYSSDSLAANYTPLQFPLVPLFARSGYRSRCRALIRSCWKFQYLLISDRRERPKRLLDRESTSDQLFTNHPIHSVITIGITRAKSLLLKTRPKLVECNFHNCYFYISIFLYNLRRKIAVMACFILTD